MALHYEYKGKADVKTWTDEDRATYNELIWQSMACDMGEITEKNAGEFCRRANLIPMYLTVCRARVVGGVRRRDFLTGWGVQNLKWSPVRAGRGVWTPAQHNTTQRAQYQHRHRRTGTGAQAQAQAQARRSWSWSVLLIGSTTPARARHARRSSGIRPAFVAISARAVIPARAGTTPAHAGASVAQGIA